MCRVVPRSDVLHRSVIVVSHTGHEGLDMRDKEGDRVVELKSFGNSGLTGSSSSGRNGV